jgi:hypothetical protein
MIKCYRELALNAMRRLISRLDRRPWSPTFGCFDREYWHYKTLIEFPRADFQQCLWGLSLLYTTPFEGNEFAANTEVLQWIKGGLEFWLRIRNADGSLNEWYPNEHSFCATAFTSAAVGETLILLEGQLDENFKAKIIASLETTVHWLLRNQNMQVANQMVAGLVALDCLRQLTMNQQYRDTYEQWKASVLAMQHSEGWFSEYGGADIGYSFLTLDLLAHLWKRANDYGIGKAINSVLDFLSYFVHPDGTIGGDYGSRSTNHCFPYGVECLAGAGNSIAQKILAAVRFAIREGLVPTPATVDDTYTAYFYVNSFCLVACNVHLTPEVLNPLAICDERKRFFPGAGLLVHATEAYYAVVSTQNGVWRVFDRRGKSYGDSGYVVITQYGKRVSSQQGGQQTVCNISEVEGRYTVEIKKRFGILDISLPLVKYVIPFKMFSLYLLRLPKLAFWFSKVLKRLKVSKTKLADLELKRIWHFASDSVELEDEMRPLGSIGVAKLYLVGEGAGMHSPSSQLYSAPALKLGGQKELNSEAKIINSGQVLHLRSTLKL